MAGSGRWRRQRGDRRGGCRCCRVPAGESESTPSSCPRAAIARCSAWSRSSSTPRASPTTSAIILIDPLDASIDVAPLAELLADPAIEVVLHAGRQDVAILRRVWDTELTNIFDTQIAAGFAGGSAQAGYGNLLGSILGRRVGKTASYTRWDARPLTAEQLELRARGRRAPARARRRAPAAAATSPAGSNGRARSAAALESATDERDPETVWERLPRIGQLDPRARAVARELAAWRERTASREDRPVGSVLADPPLVELAKRQPSDQSRDSSRSAAFTRPPCAAAARRSSTRSPGAAKREPIPREARPRSLRARRRAADRARRGAAARPRARGRAGLRADRLAQPSSSRSSPPRARGEPEPDVRTLGGLAPRARRRGPARPARRPQGSVGRRRPAPRAQLAPTSSSIDIADV